MLKSNNKLIYIGISSNLVDLIVDKISIIINYIDIFLLECCSLIKKSGKYKIYDYKIYLP